MNEICWTEERVEALPKEDNTFERKASALFAAVGSDVDHFRNELAKELSAFANSGGGSIILGADDKTGKIDGGLPLVAKGHAATKDYLEDIIPGLTDEKILGFNVIEIMRGNNKSSIAPGKAVFVIEVPDSDRAPHQSMRDQKYYVRLGSKSQPASHRIIEDIRNRLRHPKLETVGMEVLRANHDGGGLRLDLKTCVRNLSRLRGTNVCLALSASNCDLWFHNALPTEGTIRGGSRSGIGLFEITGPVYPEMELHPTLFVSLPAKFSSAKGEHAGLRVGKLADVTLGTLWEKVILTATLYCDSAPPSSVSFRLGDIDTRSAIANLLRKGK